MDHPEDVLELVRKDIAAWRRAHRGRRGPLPVDLRRQAAIVGQVLGEDAVAEVLGVEPALLVRWADRYGRFDEPPAATASGGTPAPSAFVDVGKQLGIAVARGQSSGTAAAWVLEICKPCGTIVRLQGPVDGTLIAAVLRSASAA